MPFSDRTAVVVVGGNSLIVDREHESILDQSKAAAATAHHIADMVAAGWNVVITHGSGPQVGFILRRSEIALGEVPPVPMDYAAADLQGAIGYMFQRALRNEFRGAGCSAARSPWSPRCWSTARPGVRRPGEADRLADGRGDRARRAAELGWIVREDAGRGWRRVVPSPLPQGIVEIDEIEHLVSAGYVVIACGGGGIPVFQGDDGDLQGVEAVIDKDLASSMLARELNADLFVISTSVARVAINFGRPDQRWLEQLTRAKRKRTSPKATSPKAAWRRRSARSSPTSTAGRRGLITDPANIGRALAGQAGTVLILTTRGSSAQAAAPRRHARLLPRR